MNTHRFSRFNRPGFSLVELLLVMVGVAVLLFLAVAVLGRMRTAGNDARCLHNLRQIGVATAGYFSDHNGGLPIAIEKGPKGSAWDGPGFGAWYWNLAPYLGVPRWTTVTKYLGEQGKHIWEPIVFTCPSHGKDEPGPITYPSVRPVSYAPSTRKAPPESEGRPWGDVLLQRYNIRDVVHPGRTIWISDSTHPAVLNISGARWARDADESTAWPRISFNRHHGAGNALFFDGHVESVRYESIISGDLGKNLARLFDPVEP
ncbi:MAG TPA: hypothetical protein VNQ90_07250 [Chthoniobacteraceae bacterium]|nr:hypothetical protein [Chthoniobacteraceae bacterium]